jgi:transcriptional regulator with XRE-family HTH domain
MRRLGLKMSQTALAQALGVTFQQVQKYENGTNRISASALAKVAETLDVDILYFFKGNHGPKPAAGADHEDASVQTLRTLHDLEKIKDRSVRLRLAGLIRVLSEDQD